MDQWFCPIVNGKKCLKLCFWLWNLTSKKAIKLFPVSDFFIAAYLLDSMSIVKKKYFLIFKCLTKNFLSNVRNFYFQFIKILNSLKETLEIKKSNCKKIYGVKKVTRALFAFILKIVTNFYK